MNHALRQTILLCLPGATGLMSENLQQNLLGSLVPACCNIAELNQLYKRFFKRRVVGNSLFALSSIFIQLLLVLVFGGNDEISPPNRRLLPKSLIVALFTLVLTGNVPL